MPFGALDITFTKFCGKKYPQLRFGVLMILFGGKNDYIWGKKDPIWGTNDFIWGVKSIRFGIPNLG